MTGKLPSMSDEEFKNYSYFCQNVAKRWGISYHAAEFLIFSSWRKFKLIIAKDTELRKKLKGFLDV